MMTYAALRSVHDSKVHLIVPVERIDNLPDPHRTRGPWQVLQRGAIGNLKAEYRLALARDGAVLVEQTAAIFRPEA